MTKKTKQKSPSKRAKRGILQQIWPYALSLIAIVGVAVIGSADKQNPETGSLSMSSIADSNYQVSTDQISELYMVANLSNVMDLASIDTVSSNYVTVSVMREIGQLGDSDKLEKPSIVDTSGISRGVQTYVVAAGETMASIAKKFGLTTTQIRWSNDLKDETISPGQTLYLPTVPGIVYTVKAGDSAESLATKYASPLDQIISVNDLEITNNLVIGSQIVLPSGTLPTTERPEYVAPVSTRTYAYTYTYAGVASSRSNVRVVKENWNSASSNSGNPMYSGQCTWYAWRWRRDKMPANYWLPGGSSLGNANSWVSSLSGSFRINRTPAYGAVFQTTAGYYGHVGIVTAVHADGSITVREMNYAGSYTITESEIPANLVGNFYYIHEAY